MKKMFAALCALLLVPTIASAELISITELVQETPEAWIEEIDVNGKTNSREYRGFIQKRRNKVQRNQRRVLYFDRNDSR